MTGYVCIIGDPVAHSLSPAMHDAAFAHEGLDLRYIAFRVPSGGLEAAVRGLRGLGFVGANITAPHKEAALGLMDRLAPSAQDAGAVNTVVNEAGTLVGHDTDGAGAVAALEEVGPLSGRRVAVLGAGGAARAICRALAPRCGPLLVVNRTAARGEALASFLGGRAEAIPLADPSAPARVRACDVLVNATSAGMGTDRSPLPPRALGPGMTVLDTVYRPVQTRLLRDAEAAGARTVPGTRMLLHQGAAAFELWTGRPAPLAVMEAAIGAALGGGRGPG